MHPVQSWQITDFTGFAISSQTFELFDTEQPSQVSGPLPRQKCYRQQHQIVFSPPILLLVRVLLEELFGNSELSLPVQLTENTESSPGVVFLFSPVFRAL